LERPPLLRSDFIWVIMSADNDAVAVAAVAVAVGGARSRSTSIT
jgi:hypothetical protein